MNRFEPNQGYAYTYKKMFKNKPIMLLEYSDIELNTKVRSYLIELARKRVDQKVAYQKLCDDCKLKLDMQNPDDRKKIGVILGKISNHEYDFHRPLLSGLVIRANDDYEGDGFYKLGQNLGYGSWTKLKKDGIFEAEQIGKCIAFWGIEKLYNEFK